VNAKSAEAVGGRTSAIPKAAYYALAVVTVAHILNYLDRQIVSILAQSIKADLKLDDAQLGFLLGTAFAVFYSVIGIAMGRVSDGLPRKKVLAFGLVLWSAMTALGGAAGSFLTLGLARVGVGVGESVANPCGHSLVAELFPPKNRAVAMSVLLSGIFLGGAFSMFIGGFFLTEYPHFCTAVPIASSCSLAPWKAALLAVALPGIPVALMLLAIREPPRPPHGVGSTIGFVLREIATAVPPFTMVSLLRIGGRRALIINCVIAAVISAIAAGLIALTHDTAQWAAFGLGAYAVITWSQIQKHRDRPLYALTFGDPTFSLATAAFALITCVGGAASVWAAPYAMRTYSSIPAYEIGITLGLTQISGSLLGMLFGGQVVDRWKLRDRRAPMGMCAISLTGAVPCIVLMLLVSDYHTFLVAVFLFGMFSGLWGAGGAAMIQDLVLPRMRGSAAACNSLAAVVIASGTGPYWVGKVSTLTGSLTAGLLSMLPIAPLALVTLWLCARRLPFETPEARLARAVAAGEPSPRGVPSPTTS
jgi:MFS family permease